MRSQPLFLVFTLATLTCATLASCTGASAPAASPSASAPHVSGPIGSPGNPVILGCDAEAWDGAPAPPAPVTAGPQDLAVGPMYFAGARHLATETPAQEGGSPYGRDGMFFKFGVVVRPAATVTVTIGASARGHVVIVKAVNGSDLAMTSATYHACREPGGFYPQGFAFTHPPFRGCVPLDVTVGGQAQVLHVTLSLFAGSCA